MNVDLPAPLGPMIPRIRPERSVNDTPSRARTPAKLLESAVASKTGVGSAANDMTAKLGTWRGAAHRGLRRQCGRLQPRVGSGRAADRRAATPARRRRA